MKMPKPPALPSVNWSQSDKDRMTKLAKWNRNTVLSRHGHIHFNQWFESLTKEELAIFEEATQYLVSVYIKRCCNTNFGGSVNDLPVSTTHMLSVLNWDIMNFLRIGKVEFEGAQEFDYMLRYKLLRMYTRKLLAKVYRSKAKIEWLRGANKS